MDPKEFTNFIERLEWIDRELIITRGKVHEYIRINIDFWTPGDLWVTMVDYLKGVL